MPCPTCTRWGRGPVVAVNIVGWPRDVLPLELLQEVLRGGMEIGRQAGCHIAGGQSIDDPEPKYGLAVTGLADPDRLLRNDAARAGLPISLTKPLGLGVLNNRHKATGEVFGEAIATMTTLNAAASEAALAAGLTAATDITGFGLLGHAYKMARASGVSMVIDAAAVPYVDGARQALADGYVSGGTRRNLDWVRGQLSTRRLRGRVAAARRRPDQRRAARGRRDPRRPGDRRGGAGGRNGARRPLTRSGRIRCGGRPAPRVHPRRRPCGPAAVG